MSVSLRLLVIVLLIPRGPRADLSVHAPDTRVSDSLVNIMHGSVFVAVSYTYSRLF